MKIQEVILRALARKIMWFQAAELVNFPLQLPGLAVSGVSISESGWSLSASRLCDRG